MVCHRNVRTEITDVRNRELRRMFRLKRKKVAGSLKRMHK
jgi:16S rRNA U516 pseudouridylate synthase RsuA-like enzyme